MRTVHTYAAYVVVAINLIVGGWGIVLWRRRQSEPRAFWIALGAGWAAIYVQGLLGLFLFERFQPPFRHHFYGFLFAIITLVVLPFRGEDRRRRLAAFSLATFFIGIVAVRATLSL